MDFFRIGLKKGQRLSLWSKSKDIEYAHAFVHDERHVIDDNRRVSSLWNWFDGVMSTRHMKHLLKQHNGSCVKLFYCSKGADYYIAYISIDNGKMLNKQKDEWLKSRYVVKND